MSTLALTPTRSVTHDCNGAVECMVEAPGHAVGLMQQRISAASPSLWRDFVATDASADGWVRLTSVDGSESVSVWNHSDLGIDAGSPVALHSRYNVLAVSAARFNVVVTL